MKVAVYAIALNEVPFVERWHSSAREADHVILVDTGSSDNTLSAALSLGVEVHQKEFEPWRFDDARNYALSLVPEDVDVAVALDLDEVFYAGWRKELESMWQDDATILNHKYRNNFGPWQWHSKIHNRNGCKWVGVVHETLEWSVPEKILWSPDIYLDEQQDLSKDRSFYRELLVQKLEEEDTDWKTFYFLANEYQTIGEISRSIEFRIKAYENCEEKLEKAYCSLAIAQSFTNYEESEKWFQISVGHSLERENTFAAAVFYYGVDWGKCLYYSEKCLGMTVRRNGYTFNPESWGSRPYDLAALAAYQLEEHEKALAYAAKAAELSLNETRLQANLVSDHGKLAHKM